jgi:hypothetical protein
MPETSASFASDTMNLQQSLTICKGCWQNLHLPLVLRGPLAIPFRIVGLRPSRMNPNTCTFCELAFTRIMKARMIEEYANDLRKIIRKLRKMN